MDIFFATLKINEIDQKGAVASRMWVRVIKLPHNIGVVSIQCNTVETKGSQWKYSKFGNWVYTQ